MAKPTRDRPIAYDPLSKRVIQFGGNQQYGLQTTMAYAGTAWSTLVSPETAKATDAPPGGTASAVTDQSLDTIIMQAQNSANNPYGVATYPPTTWAWNGST